VGRQAVGVGCGRVLLWQPQTVAICASCVENKADEAGDKYLHGGQSVTNSVQWVSVRSGSRRVPGLPPEQRGCGDAVNGGVSAREVGWQAGSGAMVVRAGTLQ
jgi:hypothetical protein